MLRQASPPGSQGASLRTWRPTIPEQKVVDVFLTLLITKISCRRLNFLLSCITTAVRYEVQQLLMKNLSCSDGEVRQLCLHSMLLDAGQVERCR